MIMDNKVLIKLFVPEIDDCFDIFIPVNEVIWKIKKMIVKCVNDVDGVNLDMNKDYLLVSKNEGKIYKNNELIIDTDIRNTCELLLISV